MCCGPNQAAGAAAGLQDVRPCSARWSAGRSSRPARPTPTSRCSAPSARCARARLVGAAGEDLQPAVGVLVRVQAGRSSRPATPSPPSRCSARSATCATRPCPRRGRTPRADRRRCFPTSIMSIQPPSDAQPDQPLFGAICHLCHNARRRRGRRAPSGRRRCARRQPVDPAAQRGPARPAVVRCRLPHVPHRPSAPRANTSMRPSAFWPTASWSIQPPSDAQPTSRCSVRSASVPQRRPRRGRRPPGGRRRCGPRPAGRSSRPATPSPTSRRWATVCHLCHSAPSRRARTPRSGRRRCCPTISMSIQPPSLAQPDQPLLGAVCHLCQSAWSRAAGEHLEPPARRPRPGPTAAAASRKVPIGLPGSGVTAEPVTGEDPRTSCVAERRVGREHQRRRRRRPSAWRPTCRRTRCGRRCPSRCRAGQVVVPSPGAAHDDARPVVAEARPLVLRRVVGGRADQDRAGGRDRVAGVVDAGVLSPLPAATQTTTPGRDRRLDRGVDRRHLLVVAEGAGLHLQDDHLAPAAAVGRAHPVDAARPRVAADAAARCRSRPGSAQSSAS